MTEWDSIIGLSKSYGSSYGSCVRSAQPSTTQYKKHVVESSDTVQGIALKYGISTEELRRVNKLYSSDSLFLRDSLLIPVESVGTSTSFEPTTGGGDASKAESTNGAEGSNPGEIDAASFLKQLDSKILAGKNALKGIQCEHNWKPQRFGHTNNMRKVAPLKQSSYKTDPKTVFSHSHGTNNDELFEL